MSASFADSVDAHGQWRSAMEAQVRDLAQFLAQHDLLEDDEAETLESLRQRLAGEKLVVAFVAEYSRGKSELINAMFFADTGRRVLPATAGRTTMCPVELGYERTQPPALALLPIETRMQPVPLTEMRHQHALWKLTPLDIGDVDGLARALSQVTETKRVDVATARALGLWHDDHPDDNPPVDAAGELEIPRGATR